MPVRTRDQLQKTYTEVIGEVTFTLKSADNRAVLARQNLFDKVRYISSDEAGGQTITERSFPMGDLRLETILLVLTGWDLMPAENGAPYPINHRNVTDLLEPQELEELYDRIIARNQVWGGDAGEG